MVCASCAASVDDLRGPQKDREFVISVVGEGDTKNFDVKKKHFEKLR